ncbi:MAG: RsmB/NOP family class I SAM-dependent RNA methyltransferase [Gemmatimonadota bacterium]
MGRRRRDPKREERGRRRLESYRAFIDDWEAFETAIRRPEPTTLRTNTLRISRDALAARLETQGYVVTPVPHQPAFLRVESEPSGRPVSDTLEHWMGLFYIQQTATGWAAPLLAPQPGERVLDLCSAPGGKTTHLSELMSGRGTVVASEVNETRIRALLGNLYRLGHTNVMTVAGDGRRFPTEATFDRVMVDVPCSAEGTLRKRGGRIPGHSRKWAKQVTKAQEKLLRRAIRLTRPGGTLLYVTCTFGPEENEGVLTRVLDDAPVQVDPLVLPVPHAPGLAALGDERFHPSLVGAARIYPHHLDSGGLFLCRLRR